MRCLLATNRPRFAIHLDQRWQAAHELMQHEHDEFAFQYHGYLHREEGDVSNANYWYKIAGKVQHNTTPAQELKRLYQLASLTVSTRFLISA
jgi:hypothetical protein